MILKHFISLVLVLFISMLSSTSIKAVYDPLSVPNNLFGVHILDPQEVADAAKLVNTSGGDWGYVTIPIRSDDRDREKWFNFFTDCRRLHLIPIVRLATFVDGDKWVAPTSYDLVDFANFLDTMPWPTGNRYIILFNEINHSKEWGGRVSPLEYATLILDARRIFKERSDDYFLLTAGLDMSAPDNHTSMDALKFYRLMTELQPDWYRSIDGLSVHAYPNPGFSSSVYSQTRFGISSYLHELSLLDKLHFSGKPVFITETGSPDTGDFFSLAFTQIWTETNIVAVTPFILFAGAGDFTKFSLLDLSHSPKPTYRSIEQLPKISGSPLLNTRLPPLIEPISDVTTSEDSAANSPSSGNTNFFQRLKNLFFKSKLSTVFINSKPLYVEIVDTPAALARGLSYRKSLPQDQGMLFRLGRLQTTSFWMNEMLFPLDIIWLNRGQVVHLSENIPPPAATDGRPVTVSSQVPVDQVIEVNSGLIKKYQIEIGDRVESN